MTITVLPFGTMTIGESLSAGPQSSEPDAGAAPSGAEFAARVGFGVSATSLALGRLMPRSRSKKFISQLLSRFGDSDERSTFRSLAADLGNAISGD
jgi:hypothetical protein